MYDHFRNSTDLRIITEIKGFLCKPGITSSNIPSQQIIPLMGTYMSAH